MKRKLITKEGYENIKTMLKHGMTQRKIAAIMCLSETSISRVKHSSDFDNYLCESQIRKNKWKLSHASNSENEPIVSELEQPYMTDENLLLRIADGIDYNNALMNGLVAKIDKLCKALGV